RWSALPRLGEPRLDSDPHTRAAADLRLIEWRAAGRRSPEGARWSRRRGVQDGLTLPRRSRRGNVPARRLALARQHADRVRWLGREGRSARRLSLQDERRRLGLHGADGSDRRGSEVLEQLQLLAALAALALIP